MSIPTITIRPSTISDEPEMLLVWKEVFGDDIFGGEEKVGKYLQWAFRDNPDLQKGDTAHWVAEDISGIISVWSTMPVELLVHGQSEHACWIQASAVRPRAQGLGIGRRMFRTIVDHNALTLGVGVTQAARNLYASENVKFVTADGFATLCLSPRMELRRILRAIYRRKSGDAWVFLLASWNWFLSKFESQPDGISVFPIESFGAVFEEFFARAPSSIPVMTRRSAEKLNWILANPLIGTCSFAASHNGKICGYAILRSDGMLLDLLVENGNSAAFNCLINHISIWAKDKHVTEINAIVPVIEPLATMYRSRGFAPDRNVDFGLFYSCPDTPKSAALIQPSTWYFSMAESDLWSFRAKR